MFGIALGLTTAVIYDGTAIRERGFFQGYNGLTWTVVSLQVKE